MQIIFVAPFGLGEKTTVWARTLPLARELAGRDHAVAIVIPPWDTPADAGRTWQEGGVTLINVRLGGGLLFVLRRLLGQIDSRTPQIVHIVKPRAHAGLVQTVLWQRRRRLLRLLLDIDDWEQAWAPINRYAPPVARFLAWQEEWGIRHADGITAASRWLEARAKTYAPQTPRLYLPNGVNEKQSVLSATPDEGGPIILFFSRYVEVPPEWLSSFWGSLHSWVPTARLLVAGRPLQTERMEHFRRQMEAGDAAAAAAVEWLGGIEPESVPALYAQAACAVFPAENVPLQEAKCSVRLATTLLAGVPVVASAVGEQANYGAGGAARLVPATATPAEFAAAVAELLHSRQERTLLAAKARDHLLAHYRWSDLAGRLEGFYAQILAAAQR